LNQTTFFYSTNLMKFVHALFILFIIFYGCCKILF